MFFLKKKEIKKKEESLNNHNLLKKKRDIEAQIDYNLQILEDSSGDEMIKIYNKLGKLYLEIGNTDKAIEYYEQSIANNKMLGQAYKDLIKLYNIKRQEALKEGNSEKVQYYLNKTDKLLKLSKDVIRGRV